MKTAHNFWNAFRRVPPETDVMIRDDVGNLYRPYEITMELGMVVIQVQLEHLAKDGKDG